MGWQILFFKNQLICFTHVFYHICCRNFLTVCQTLSGIWSSSPYTCSHEDTFAPVVIASLDVSVGIITDHIKVWDLKTLILSLSLKTAFCEIKGVFHWLTKTLDFTEWQVWIVLGKYCFEGMNYYSLAMSHKFKFVGVLEIRIWNIKLYFLSIFMCPNLRVCKPSIFARNQVTHNLHIKFKINSIWE